MSKSSFLILAVLFTFALSTLGLQYNVYTKSEEENKGVSTLLSIGSLVILAAMLVFGLQSKMGNDGQYVVGVRGSGNVIGFVLFVILLINTIITAKTVSSCKGTDAECNKKELTAFFVLSGITLFMLMAYVAAKGKKAMNKYKVTGKV